MGKTTKAAGVCAAIAILAIIATIVAIACGGSGSPIAAPLAIVTGLSWLATLVLAVVGAILDRKGTDKNDYPADPRDAVVPQDTAEDWRRFLPFSKGRLGRADLIFAQAMAGLLYFVACAMAGVAFGVFWAVTDIEITDDAADAVALALFVPVAAGSIGWNAKRCHDIGKSGWWQALLLVPLAGIYASIVLMARPSQPAGNRFGPVPTRSIGGWWALAALVAYVAAYVLLGLL